MKTTSIATGLGAGLRCLLTSLRSWKDRVGDRRATRPAPARPKPGVEALEGRMVLDTGLGQLAAAGVAPSQFVSRLYQDALQRTAPPAEVAGWVAVLNAGVSPAQVAQAFVGSAEHRATVIQNEYRTELGRDAEPAAVTYWLGQMQAGLTQEQLQAAFLGSDESYRLQGSNAAPWVAHLYQELLGRAPDTGGAAFWSQALANGLPRPSLALTIANTAEAHARDVADAYHQFLQRDPDPGGMSSWLAALQHGLPTSQLPATLASTPEYFGIAAHTEPAPPPTPTPTPPPGPTGGPQGVQLGADASLGGARLFPADNAWNQDVSGQAVDPNSANLIASIGLTRGLHPDFGTTYNGAPNGIPYIVVPGTQPKVPVTFDYASESDPGPYPIPPDAPIEGGANSTGDRHVLILDRDNWKLYELYDAHKQPDGSWHAGSGAIFNLNSDTLRPAGWTSADAAGLPILPGLVRYDEVMQQGVINHALRFTVSQTRRAYLAPATHFASSNTNPNLPPMGMRVRLKANVDISRYPAPVRVILTALKKYGMIVADNGSSWFVSGAPDPRWDDNALAAIGGIKGSDFEVVQMNGVVTG